MAKLKAKQRNALPSSDFAGPNRSFPIPDATHARQALRERKFAPNPQAIVRKVEAQYPSIKPRAMGGPVDPGQDYVVGEKGPELFEPKAKGLIRPALPRTKGVRMPRMNAGMPRTPRVAMPKPSMPKPRGIRGTNDFKSLMGKLKGMG